MDIFVVTFIGDIAHKSCTGVWGVFTTLDKASQAVDIYSELDTLYDYDNSCKGIWQFYTSAGTWQIEQTTLDKMGAL